ncbi:MAG: pilus assembly protein PilP [Gammaproteobacteria bacterium]|nr:pilus assembly protein PilP [Gammaproteobacteria bacterium]
MKMTSYRINRIILTLPALALAVTACSKDINDLQDFIAQTKASGVGSVRPIPQFRPYQSFAYSANDLRDPFVAAIDLAEDPGTVKNSLHPETDRPKQQLEVFPLDTLSMVGTLEQNDNSWGLIKDPQNVVHKVKLGDYMGQNEGRVTGITETSIYLVEIVPDGVGGYVERDASIAVGNE